jgi:hypothetical protein
MLILYALFFGPTHPKTSLALVLVMALVLTVISCS